MASADMTGAALYRTIWRWHFYAALLVMPLVLVLASSGAIYLFKPQIDRWEERDWRGLGTAGAVSPDAQLAAVLAAYPGAHFHAYRLPQTAGDAAMVHLALPPGDRGGRQAGGQRMVDVFVSPQGKVLGSLDPEARIAPTIARFHGSLLLGRAGDWLVELAASWAIVMILTGLYLWWPEGRGLACVAWPRLARGSRTAWRDMHAVTGFWVSGLALVLLCTGLPWAGVWGSGFRMVRTELGWVKGPQQWKVGAGSAPTADPHAAHDHAAMAGMTHTMQPASAPSAGQLSRFVDKAQGQAMAFPVLVLPPHAPQRFGPPTGNVWTVKSEAQNRTLNRAVSYDPVTGAEVARDEFAAKHPIDRMVAYGVAWHEGQLLGLFNQLVGVATALMLITLVISGFVMWRRRKPDGALGAPPLPASPARLRGMAVILLLLAALLPLLAASLIALLLVERVILRRIPAASRWLGLAPA